MAAILDFQLFWQKYKKPTKVSLTERDRVISLKFSVLRVYSCIKWHPFSLVWGYQFKVACFASNPLVSPCNYTNNMIVLLLFCFPEYFVNFGGSRVPVKLADYRMKNGMIHVIEAVLFSSSSGASEYTSSASHMTLSHVLCIFYIVCSILTTKLLVAS